MMSASVTILGARGSVPVCSPAFARYGGATTSILLCMEGEAVVIDAGTGILNLPAAVLERPELSLVLTHTHLDHLNGFSMCPYVTRDGAGLNLYAAAQGGLPIDEVLTRLYSPPLWPITPENLPIRLTYRDVSPEFSIGGVQVRSMDGVHPGGVKLYRFQGGGKSVVVITDCTLSEALFPAAVEFARGCDLLLCDGQYSDEEWPQRAGFGHTTWTTAAHFAAACGAKMLRIVHHDPTHTDAILDAAAAEVRAIHSASSFAYQGEEIEL